MLVAIAGSQGSGKSTTLKALKEKGYKVIERKTSRSILEEWGVSLKEVNDDPTLTLKFQAAITQRKYDDELAAMHDDQIWFTERTHADFFSYALVSLGKDNTYSEWLDEYYDICDVHNSHYMRIFYLQAGHFEVVHDGVRGSNQHYSRMVDITMLDFTEQLSTSHQLTIIDTPHLDDRVSTILNETQKAFDSRHKM